MDKTSLSPSDWLLHLQEDANALRAQMQRDGRMTPATRAAQERLLTRCAHMRACLSHALNHTGIPRREREELWEEVYEEDERMVAALERDASPLRMERGVTDNRRLELRWSEIALLECQYQMRATRSAILRLLPQLPPTSRADLEAPVELEERGDGTIEL